jgi:hypothetical protein
MKKIIFSVLMLFLSSLAFAQGVHITGNGGGGIYKDGNFLTIGSAQISLPKEIKPETSIPGLALLEMTIECLDIPDLHKARLMQAIIPTSYDDMRNYFSVSDSAVSVADRRKIVQAYAKVLGNQVPAKDIVLFALTLSDKKMTYLLPEFYNLQQGYQQAAILFHEAEWVFNRNLSYVDVMRGEELMQTQLALVQSEVMDQQKQLHSNSIYDEDLFASLDLILEDHVSSFMGLAHSESRAQKLKPLMSSAVDGRFPLPYVLGWDDLNYTRILDENDRSAIAILPSPRDVSFNLDSLLGQFPNIQTLKMMYDLQAELQFLLDEKLASLFCARHEDVSVPRGLLVEGAKIPTASMSVDFGKSSVFGDGLPIYCQDVEVGRLFPKTSK